MKLDYHNAMKHLHITTLLALTLLFILGSCLNDDEKYADYDDTAVISFVLQQMNAYVHTTNSQGEDSVFRAYVDGPKVPIYIDNVNNEIYNVDSLPASTDIEHVVVELATKNNCYALWRSLTEEKLLYHSSTDSLDFSVPRELYVFTTSGDYYRVYTVRIVKHQQDGDMFHWRKQATNNTFAALKGMKAASNGHTIFLAGTDGQTTTLYATSADDATAWHTVATNLPEQAWQTLLVHQGKPHLNDQQGNLYVVESNDDYATAATRTYNTNSLATLIATDNQYLYALATQGGIVRTTQPGNYTSWSIEALDDDAVFLPTSHITATHIPLRTTDDAGRIVIVGNRAPETYPADTCATLWARMTGSAEVTAGTTWMHYTGQGPIYRLPRLYNISTIAYGTDILALGGTPMGNTQTRALTNFYRSIDGGISWHKDTRIDMPTDMECSHTVFALTTDYNNYIWLICGQSGQIWKGRLNRMAWTEHQKEFR